MLFAFVMTLAGVLTSPQAQLDRKPDLIIRFTEAELQTLGARFPHGRGFRLVEGLDGGSAVQFNEPEGPPDKKKFSVIQIPHRAEMHFTTGATFDFWVRIDKAAGFDGLGKFTEADAWNATLVGKSGDRVGFSLMYYQRFKHTKRSGVGWETSDWTFNGSGCESARDLPELNAGTWFRVTVTLDSRRGSRVFINQRWSYECINSRPDFKHTNTQDLFLGANGALWAPFTGSLQDLAIYKHALSEEEVARLPTRYQR